MKSRIVKKNSVLFLVLIPLLLFGINTFEASADVIIDNSTAGTSFTGSWSASGATGYYGTNSLWSRDGATYTWQFDSQPSGTYEVYMWWSGFASRASSVNVDILNANGTNTVNINQKLNAGQWNSLGQFQFNGSGSVKIIAANGSTVSTCADAVWFRYVSGGVPTETIIDNSTPGTSSTGAWSASGATGYYGANSLWSRDGDTYTWTFTPQQSGQYDLSMWWTVWSSRSANIPVDIQYAGGLSTRVYINQLQNGSKWNILGTYSFTSGVSYKVTITSQAGPSSTCADAVKFSYVSGGGNTAPVANSDTATTTENSPVTVDVLANDTDAEGNIDPATVVISSNPEHGTAVPQSNGTVEYTPTTGYTGADTFTYTVKDTEGAESNTATVTLTVTAIPVNSPPVAVNDTAQTITNTPVTINVASNDTDADGTLDLTTCVVTASPAHGTAVEQGNCTVLYTPTTGYNGADTFTYTVKDNDGAVSNTATVQVAVNSSSVPETIIDNSTAGTSFTGAWSVSGASGYYGANSLWSRDGDTYTWTFTPQQSGQYDLSMWWTVWSSRSANIPVDIQYAGGSTRVYINQLQNGSKWNILGTYSFTSGVSYKVTITSQAGPSSTCADAVKFSYVSGGGNTAPVANSDTATTTENSPVTVDVLANDTDAEGNIDPATVVISSNPEHGTAVPQSNGTVEYTPTTGYTGADTFTYTVKDTEGAESNTATVTLTVTAIPVNSPPVAVNDTAQTITNTPVTINVASNDTDADGTLDLTTCVVTASPAHGTAVEQGNCTVLYTPTTGYNGADAFTYTVKDNDGAVSNAATVQVTVNSSQNAAPRASNDSADTTVNTPVTINVIANDTDSYGTIDPATCIIMSGPSNGTAVAQSNGTVLYTPNSGYTGKDTFTYTVRDSLGMVSNAATVTVTVGIVIDNGASGTSSTGTWTVATDPNPYGANSLWGRNGATYTWTFTPAVSGNYEISMWWTYATSRSDHYTGGYPTLWRN